VGLRRRHRVNETRRRAATAHPALPGLRRSRLRISSPTLTDLDVELVGVQESASQALPKGRYMRLAALGGFRVFGWEFVGQETPNVADESAYSAISG
jgi:hypothetical protein